MAVKERTDGKKAAWTEPFYMPPELARPYDVQEVLRNDSVPPAETLRHASNHGVGEEPVDVSRYFSTDFHKREVDKLWSRTWQWAVWSYDIPNPGDVGVYRIVDRSVIIVRQPDLSLKAFVNSCLHRGRELCAADGQVNQLRCPYHGFTWSIRGDLKRIPAQWDFPQVKPEEFRLPEVRVEEWNGFIFVNFDKEAPSLRSYMGAMFDQWGGEKPQGAWNFEGKYKAVHLYREIKCNWKVCQEGFMETHHVNYTHPQLMGITPETSAQHDIYPNEPHFSRAHFITGFASAALRNPRSNQEVLDAFTSSYMTEHHGTEFGKIREGETLRQAFSRLSRDVFAKRLKMDVSKLSDAELIDGTQYFLFPNFLPWPSVLHPLVYRFRPLGDDPNWCIWETLLFLPFDGERPPSCKIIHVGQNESFEDYKAMGALDRILQEDSEQLPLVQAGLKASVTGKVNFSIYQEGRIRHFHQTLDKYLKG
ncbi:MAG TPA: aromatic ring-hydroxylating dioxygenase subunit alpha [Steroidobacteraceae bacterium]|jgi:phenylpropionate dioxygenase-like ring-hydroxylating dioxygenase large terminal subunit